MYSDVAQAIIAGRLQREKQTTINLENGYPATVENLVRILHCQMPIFEDNLIRDGKSEIVETDYREGRFF